MSSDASPLIIARSDSSSFPGVDAPAHNLAADQVEVVARQQLEQLSKLHQDNLAKTQKLVQILKVLEGQAADARRISQQLNQARSDLLSKGSELSILQDEFYLNEDQIKGLKAEIALLQSDSQDSARIKELEGLLKARTQDVADIQKKIDEVNEDIAARKEIIEKMGKEKEKLEKDLAAHPGAMQQTRAKILQARQKVGVLKKQIEQLQQQEKEAAQARRFAHSEEMRGLRSKIGPLESSANSLAEELALEKTALKASNARRLEARAQYTALTSSLLQGAPKLIKDDMGHDSLMASLDSVSLQPAERAVRLQTVKEQNLQLRKQEAALQQTRHKLKAGIAFMQNKLTAFTRLQIEAHPDDEAVIKARLQKAIDIAAGVQAEEDDLRQLALITSDDSPPNTYELLIGGFTAALGNNEKAVRINGHKVVFSEEQVVGQNPIIELANLHGKMKSKPEKISSLEARKKEAGADVAKLEQEIAMLQEKYTEQHQRVLALLEQYEDGLTLRLEANEEQEYALHPLTIESARYLSEAGMKICLQIQNNSFNLKATEEASDEQ